MTWGRRGDVVVALIRLHRHDALGRMMFCLPSKSQTCVCASPPPTLLNLYPRRVCVLYARWSCHIYCSRVSTSVWLHVGCYVFLQGVCGNTAAAPVDTRSAPVLRNFTLAYVSIPFART